MNLLCVKGWKWWIHVKFFMAHVCVPLRRVTSGSVSQGGPSGRRAPADIVQQWCHHFPSGGGREWGSLRGREKTQISKTVWQRPKKEQADDCWCESPIKAPTADSTLCYRHRLLTGPTNKINEASGSNKIQLVSTTDSRQSLYPRFKTSTKASINNYTVKWRAKCWNPNPARLSNTFVPNRNSRDHLVGAFHSWASKVTVAHTLQIVLCGLFSLGCQI